MIKLSSRGSFTNTFKFLNRMKQGVEFPVLEKYGPIGVAALSAATPVDSGETRDSWYYEITKKQGYFAIHWYNSHIEDGALIAVLVQYGHGTRNGGFVQGTDYINPVMHEIFASMANDMWKEVTK